MEVEIKKLLYDLEQALHLLQEFTQGQPFETYAHNAMLRSAVERQFEIVGEALNRLSKRAPALVSQISDYQRIIAFRNVLAHGYDVVSDAIVWDIVQNKLPTLQAELDELKRTAGMK